MMSTSGSTVASVLYIQILHFGSSQSIHGSGKNHFLLTDGKNVPEVKKNP